MSQSKVPKHHVKAFLYPNTLNSGTEDFIARVVSERSLNVNDICKSAIARGGVTDSSPEAMAHTVQLFLKEMAYQLMDGFSVNTGYFTAAIGIKGVFNSPAEKFNPQKHAAYIQFIQGDILRKQNAFIEVEIAGVGSHEPLIADVLDVRSGLVNSKISPNRNLKITGSRLRIVGDLPEVGIYFINTVNNNRIKLDMADIVTNTPSELIIVAPDLSAGSYQLELTTQYSTHHTLKSTRTTRLEHLLTVEG